MSKIKIKEGKDSTELMLSGLPKQFLLNKSVKANGVVLADNS